MAVEAASVIGFVVARVDPGDGLLPCLVGEIGELYVVPSAAAAGAAARGLAEAAVAELRQRDVWTIRCLISADARDEHALWREVGFVPDLVGMSLYREQ